MKTQLPIDSSGLTFIAVIPPEPVLDRKTKQQEADANGEPVAITSGLVARLNGKPPDILHGDGQDEARGEFIELGGVRLHLVVPGLAGLVRLPADQRLVVDRVPQPLGVLLGQHR